jgi:hypothetical protein
MPSSIDPAQNMGLGQAAMGMPQGPSPQGPTQTQGPSMPQVQGPMYSPASTNIPMPQGGGGGSRVTAPDPSGIGQSMANVGAGIRGAAQIKYQKREKEREEKLAVQGQALGLFLQGVNGSMAEKYRDRQAFRDTTYQALLDGSLSPTDYTVRELEFQKRWTADRDEIMSRVSKYSEGLDPTFKPLGDALMQGTGLSEYSKAQKYLNPDQAQTILDRNPWIQDQETVKQLILGTPDTELSAINQTLMLGSSMTSKLRTLKTQADVEAFKVQANQSVQRINERAAVYQDNAKNFMGTVLKINPQNITFDPNGLHNLTPESEVVMNKAIATEIVEPFVGALQPGRTPREVIGATITGMLSTMDSVEGQSGGYKPGSVGDLVSQLILAPESEFQKFNPYKGEAGQRISPSDALAFGVLLGKIEPYLRQALDGAEMGPNFTNAMRSELTHMAMRANDMREWGSADHVLSKYVTPLRDAITAGGDPEEMMMNLRQNMEMLGERSPGLLVGLAAGQGAKVMLPEEWMRAGAPLKPLYDPSTQGAPGGMGPQPQMQQPQQPMGQPGQPQMGQPGQRPPVTVPPSGPGNPNYQWPGTETLGGITGQPGQMGQRGSQPQTSSVPAPKTFREPPEPDYMGMESSDPLDRTKEVLKSLGGFAKDAGTGFMDTWQIPTDYARAGLGSLQRDIYEGVYGDTEGFQGGGFLDENALQDNSIYQLLQGLLEGEPEGSSINGDPESLAALIEALGGEVDWETGEVIWPEDN